MVCRSKDTNEFLEEIKKTLQIMVDNPDINGCQWIVLDTNGHKKSRYA